LIEGTLEDRAGNSIERPFEVFLPAGRPNEVKQSVIAFRIEESPNEVDPSSER
jgi:hypothetical protein